MSFVLSEPQHVPNSSKELNEYISTMLLRALPTDELLSELPFSKELIIKPSYGVKAVFESFLDTILDFDVRSSDVFVCSQPKCGSSWMQIIVWLLTHGLDYKTIETVDRMDLMGDFDVPVQFDAIKEKASKFQTNSDLTSLSKSAAFKKAWDEVFEAMPKPRVLKTHNQVYFMPKRTWKKGAKVIYITRNPKDMTVSRYHFLRNVFHVTLKMGDIVDGTTNDVFLGAPHINHILNFWEVKHLSNVLFVAYEDLVNNALPTIRMISDFLECKYTDSQLMELAEYISFDKMKNIQTINREADIERMENKLGRKRPDAEFRFLRKGEVGGYREELNEEQIHKINEWIERELKGTDFQFKI